MGCGWIFVGHRQGSLSNSFSISYLDLAVWYCIQYLSNSIKISSYTETAMLPRFSQLLIVYRQLVKCFGRAEFINFTRQSCQCGAHRGVIRRTMGVKPDKKAHKNGPSYSNLNSVINLFNLTLSLIGIVREKFRQLSHILDLRCGRVGCLSRKSNFGLKSHSHKSYH